ncbi:MAG TPA: elongation factor 1-beta [Candidatus Dormibacteraeota bacterium]|jgi:translation elongation factor aEF-1 beta|nr:elongation factor 1-beta [Candidatus Dormibacteraeota bacterium]
MTQVLVTIKIFPQDAPANMDVLKDKVRKTLEGKASIYKYEEEPVAFGLVALVAHVLVPEEVQGRMDEVEDLLKGTPGISEVQVMVSRRIA